MHVKRWINSHGGTRSYYLAERLSEYCFFRNYLAPSHELKFWKMLVAIGLRGVESKNEIAAGRRD